MSKQVNAAHETIIGNATADRPQPPPRNTPQPPALPEPPTASPSTPPEPVDDSAPGVFIAGVLTAVAAGHIAGWLAEATGFAEELALLFHKSSAGRRRRRTRTWRQRSRPR